MHEKAEILEVMMACDAAAVATANGPKIRTRMMHYWPDEDFTVYLASLKGDPKTLQLTLNPSINLLMRKSEPDENDMREVELIGSAALVKDEATRTWAFERLSGRSSIVRYLVQTGNTKVLELIKVEPEMVKLRLFREIVLGVPPTVLTWDRGRGRNEDLAQLARKAKSWATELRLPFLTATLVPILLGTVIAWAGTGLFLPWVFALTLLGGILLHLGTNVINDYFDHRTGADEANVDFVRPFTGGSRAIQLGLLSPLEVLTGAIFCFIGGSLIGLYLTVTRGPWVLLLGLIGVASGVTYTMPRINLVGRGIGELTVGLNFGVLMTLGAYYVQTLTLSWEPLIAALPVSALISGVLYINEFQDVKADASAKKRTLVVRWGQKKAVWGYIGLVAFAYGSILVAVLTGVTPAWTLLGLLGLPLLVRGIRVARKHYASSFDLVPANASMVLAHLITGLALSVGYIVDEAGLGGWLPLSLIGATFVAIVLIMSRHVARQMEIFAGLKRSTAS